MASLEQRVAEKLRAALHDLAATGVSVPGAVEGLATGVSGEAIIRLITYTQAGESGASLRAAGWRVVAERRPHPGWNRPSRPRRLTGTEGIPRTLWEAS